TVNAITRIGAAASAAACGCDAKVVRTTSVEKHHGILRLMRTLGNDVDNPVNSIGSPERRTRSPNHLNTRDILQDEVLNLPEHPRENRRIHRATIDHYKEFVRRGEIESPRRNRPAAGVETRDVEAGHKPE